MFQCRCNYGSEYAPFWVEPALREIKNGLFETKVTAGNATKAAVGNSEIGTGSDFDIPFSFVYWNTKWSGSWSGALVGSSGNTARLCLVAEWNNINISNFYLWNMEYAMQDKLVLLSPVCVCRVCMSSLQCRAIQHLSMRSRRWAMRCTNLFFSPSRRPGTGVIIFSQPHSKVNFSLGQCPFGLMHNT